MTAFPETQQAAALSRANAVRKARSRLRQEIGNAPPSQRAALVSDILRTRPDCVATLMVQEIVEWAVCGQAQELQIDRILRESGVGYGGKEIRSLTERQAYALAEAIWPGETTNQGVRHAGGEG